MARALASHAASLMDLASGDDAAVAMFEDLIGILSEG
jgi:hypothetical protein